MVAFDCITVNFEFLKIENFMQAAVKKRYTKNKKNRVRDTRLFPLLNLN